jgi:hypothetical protein
MLEAGIPADAETPQIVGLQIRLLNMDSKGCTSNVVFYIFCSVNM